MVSNAPLWVFGCALLFFHTSEYYLQSRHVPTRLSLETLLLSPQYLTALGIGLMEYLIEKRLFNWKEGVYGRVSFWCGLIGIVVGELLRKMAMLQNRWFTHMIATERRNGHRLITTGVYRYIRHPGYAGWFIWAISTQIMLANPISTIGYGVVSWYFFNDRIKYEEALLLDFFGLEYEKYITRTVTGVPGVRGAGELIAS
ncbi:Isoprenylcysteine carboxyl methyltransferase [Giardia muris]|uniref:Protein-S-isoprenylcysteine O-methyltransferase n=1 Tax=Giardia muris TaxID=5742 RepID=A0A4Z1SSQ2_GIAMU|nr:Isoprenylcysteine carboxyl methyltransferase [Giardia muris]|eukprot:TNJ28894.1 Isoprenylcysteine carboxyl methyltransferase [Giardia muris]